jgi:hypothetical protein
MAAAQDGPTLQLAKTVVADLSKEDFDKFERWLGLFRLNKLN